MKLQTALNGVWSMVSFIGLNKIAPIEQDNLVLASFQKSFNEELKKYLERKLSAYKLLTDEALIHKTATHCVDLINHGGKRIRPYISFLAYCTEGGSDVKTIQNIGIGLETFHAFALIHDDIIDQGKERHGLPTIHEYLKGDKKRIAEAMALLAGDLVFSWANEAVINTGNMKARHLYFRMIEETVAGQMLDVALVTKDRAVSKVLMKKNELKTARYSFVNPMLIGAAEANSHVHDEFYTKLGLCLGQAFQIQDDLLDVIGNPEKTGKTNMLDVQDGQHTFITEHVFEHGDQRDRDVLSSLFGKPADESSKKVLLSLFTSSGALESAKAKVRAHFLEAREMIKTFDVSPLFKERWLALIDMLDKRNI